MVPLLSILTFIISLIITFLSSIFLKLNYFEGIKFEDAFMEAPIQELENEFDLIDFNKIMSNNQDENIEIVALDINQNQENVDIQFHAQVLNMIII